MKELELVFEVLECCPYGVEALCFEDGGVIVFGTEVLDEDEAAAVFGGGRRVSVADVVGVLKGFDRAEEVGPGDGVDGVAELVVEVPDFLQNRFDFLDLHVPFHFIGGASDSTTQQSHRKTLAPPSNAKKRKKGNY